MDPPTESSIVQISDTCWKVGSSVICEISNSAESPSNSILASWKEGENTLVLRKATEEERKGDPSWTTLKNIFSAGDSHTEWRIGSRTFCKSNSWTEEMELESDTIKFVKTHCPDLPVPEIIFSWIDHDWKRSFMFTKWFYRSTVNNKWASWSPSQRSKIIQEIVGYCTELAKVSSPRFQTALGFGNDEPALDFTRAENLAPWQRQHMPPMSTDEFMGFLRKRSGSQVQDIIPPCGDTFHFCHPLLIPTGIMVSDDAKVTCIIHWDIAGFFPKFWMALKPKIFYGFGLMSEDRGKDVGVDDYSDQLCAGLKAAGFDLTDDMIRWYKGSEDTLDKRTRLVMI
jgi:hypothetical protein